MKYWTFKIFPGKKRDRYYLVHVFHNKRSMYKYRDSLNRNGATPMRKPHRYAALCSAYNSTAKGENRQYGVLMFTQRSASSSGIVAHEIAHAVNYWWTPMERSKWRDVNETRRDKGKADERFAWLIGHCVAQYWREWYAMREAMNTKRTKTAP